VSSLLELGILAGTFIGGMFGGYYLTAWLYRRDE